MKLFEAFYLVLGASGCSKVLGVPKGLITTNLMSMPVTNQGLIMAEATSFSFLKKAVYDLGKRLK